MRYEISSEKGGTLMANFLFVLSRDDKQAATRCFQFAQIAHQKEHTVNLFFIEIP